MENRSLNHVAAAITEFFSNVITADNDVFTFAESALGISDVEELARRLSDDDSYGDGLVDLVFFPDHKLRLALECLIPLHGFSSEEIGSITGLISTDLKTATVLIKDSCMAANVEITGTIMKRFIGRLNLDIRLPFNGPGDFPESLSDDDIISIRVLVRNARYRPTSERDRVILALIAGLTAMAGESKTELIHDCLKQLLDLFNENRPDSDIFKILSDTKRYFTDLLEKISQFTDFLDRYSMEFLMSKKMQPPVADAEEIRKRMRLLDLICSAVYGRPADTLSGGVILQFNKDDGNTVS